MAQAYLIRPSVIAPLVTSATLGVFAFTWSVWWLVGIPFAILGTICGQPNLNLADGCLAWFAGLAGVVITAFHRDCGTAIAVSSIGGLILGAIEKTIFAVPDTEAEHSGICSDEGRHASRTSSERDGRTKR